MNAEQVKSLIRTLIATFGGTIAGFFAAKGWFTIDQTLSVLNSPVFLGLIMSVGGVIWGQLGHTSSGIVAAANALPAVQGVITTPTVEGQALAASIPEKTVAVAGTQDAASVAAK